MHSSWLVCVCVHTIMNALFHPRNELKQPEHKQGRPSSLWFPSKHTYLSEFVLYTYSFLWFLIQDSSAGDADPAIDSSETIPVCTQQKITLGQFILLDKTVSSKPLDRSFQIITVNIHIHYSNANSTERLLNLQRQMFKATHASSFNLPVITSDEVWMLGFKTGKL